MNGNLIWLEVDTETLDRTVRDAQAAIRRGADRFRVVSVAHADLRSTAKTPCLAAIVIGLFDEAMDEGMEQAA